MHPTARQAPVGQISGAKLGSGVSELPLQGHPEVAYLKQSTSRSRGPSRLPGLAFPAPTPISTVLHSACRPYSSFCPGVCN